MSFIVLNVLVLTVLSCFIGLICYSRGKRIHKKNRNYTSSHSKDKKIDRYYYRHRAERKHKNHQQLL